MEKETTKQKCLTFEKRGLIFGIVIFFIGFFALLLSGEGLLSAFLLSLFIGFISVFIGGIFFKCIPHTEKIDDVKIMIESEAILFPICLFGKATYRLLLSTPKYASFKDVMASKPSQELTQAAHKKEIIAWEKYKSKNKDKMFSN